MRQETEGALTPLPPAVEGAGVRIVAHGLRHAEVERGGRALPLRTPLRVPVVLHSQERVARLLTRASEGAPVGVNLSKMESMGYQKNIVTSSPVVESFFIGQDGTTMSTRRLPELAGTNSRADRFAAWRNTVDWESLGWKLIGDILHLKNKHRSWWIWVQGLIPGCSGQGTSRNIPPLSSSLVKTYCTTCGLPTISGTGIHPVSVSVLFFSSSN